MFIPDPNYSIPDPGSRVKKIPDPGSASKNLSIFNPKIVSKLSEICFGIFIPDPDLDIFPIPDPGFKKAPDRTAPDWFLFRIQTKPVPVFI
jgi:hypothetical protein